MLTTWSNSRLKEVQVVVLSVFFFHSRKFLVVVITVLERKIVGGRLIGSRRLRSSQSTLVDSIPTS